MALILAIEPDQRQAAQLTGIARHRLNADLILADTTERALDAIGDRVPDLVLIPALLSPQDDAALAAALRVIAAAANVRTLTIPVFASAAPRTARRAVLGRWRRSRESQTPDGCDPAVFAEQVSTYLAESIAERAAIEPETPAAHASGTTTFDDEVFFEPVPAAAFQPPPAYEPPSVLVAALTQPIIESTEPPIVTPSALAPPIAALPVSAIVIPNAPAILESASHIVEPPAPAMFESTAAQIVAWEATPIVDAAAFAPAPDEPLLEYRVVPDAIVESVPALVEEIAAQPDIEPVPAMEVATADLVVEPIELLADLVAEPPAKDEATILAFQPAPSSLEVEIDHELFAAPIADVVAEEELGEAAAVLAFHPAFSRGDEPTADAVTTAALDDAPIADAVTDAALDHAPFAEEVPVQAFDAAAFDVSEFTADIIEIDLSDETLGEAVDEEPVFELNVDDGDEAFAIEEVPGSRVSPQPFAETATPFANATALFMGAELDEAASHIDLDERARHIDPDDVQLQSEFGEPSAAADLELWMPLSVGAAHLWPVMEGIASEFVDPFAAPAAPPQAPKAEHPEWTELIASLRQDMERRREAVEPTPITRVVPRRKAKPVQDEWGFFDPQQCGFAALLAKLDEITEANEEQPASRLA
jgi:hypothetical protein